MEIEVMMKQMLPLVLWRCWWALLLVFGWFNVGDLNDHINDGGMIVMAIGGVGLIVSMVVGAKQPLE